MKLIAALVATVVLGLLSLPMLLAGGDDRPPVSACSSVVVTAPTTRSATSRAAAPSTSTSVASADGSPSILGPSTLTAAQIEKWWTAQGKGQPARLAAPINDVIAAYVNEGDKEGVRGDLAFAQAILETGWFTNNDTSINNYAGIGHYDNAPSGFAFPSPAVGVRAQIQLLKKFALGNDAPMASPDVSPNAGAHATTWAQLATRWATAPDYWTKLSAVYSSMTGGRPVTAGVVETC
jgi:N-acetylmuramoyl-L-alanine amidase